MVLENHAKVDKQLILVSTDIPWKRKNTIHQDEKNEVKPGNDGFYVASALILSRP
jgi:hypothetical protein